MKANIHHILEAYKALDSLSTEELEVSDIIAILGVKRVLRPIKEEYDAFVKDATHSLRPADFDKLVEIEQRIDSASDEEKAARIVTMWDGVAKSAAYLQNATFVK